MSKDSYENLAGRMGLTLKLGQWLNKIMMEEKKEKVISPKKKKDDWEEELQRMYVKWKFSYKPWIYER